MFQWLLKRSKNPLFIKNGEALLQIDGRVYRLPKGADHPRRFQHNKRVMSRTRELAKEYGINFVSFKYGIVCHECEHTSLYLESAIALEEASVSNGQSGCFYRGREDTSLVCLFTDKNRKIAFMAVEQSCAVKDAFFRTLVEQGFFDKYLLESVEPKNFPHIRNFEQENELEKKASKEYQEMRSQ